MSGIFNGRPPKPGYLFVWNVETVVQFIKSKWRNSEELSEKNLTYKLTMLMALTSASRSDAIHHLNIDYKVRSQKGYVFTFHKLHKGWKKGDPAPSLTFYEYNLDKQLCVVETIDA